MPVEVARMEGYYPYFHFAEKKGYSGVAVFSKTKPLRVRRTLGLEQFDRGGRSLQLEFSDFTLLNLYMPHGGRMKEGLSYKLACYERIMNHLRLQKNQPMILVGDFNIAHTALDLARPVSNKNNIMFTPEERHQLDDLLAIGFVDSFRGRNPHANGHYSWWPYGFEARPRNVGWRIDYTFVSTALVSKIINARICPGVFGSDHCPVGVEIESTNGDSSNRESAFHCEH